MKKVLFAVMLISNVALAQKQRPQKELQDNYFPIIKLKTELPVKPNWDKIVKEWQSMPALPKGIRYKFFSERDSYKGLEWFYVENPNTPNTWIIIGVKEVAFGIVYWKKEYLK